MYLGVFHRTALKPAPLRGVMLKCAPEVSKSGEVDGNIGQRDAGTARHDELRCMWEGGRFSRDQKTVVCPLLSPMHCQR